MRRRPHELHRPGHAAHDDRVGRVLDHEEDPVDFLERARGDPLRPSRPRPAAGRRRPAPRPGSGSARTRSGPSSSRPGRAARAGTGRRRWRAATPRPRTRRCAAGSAPGSDRVSGACWWAWVLRLRRFGFREIYRSRGPAAGIQSAADSKNSLRFKDSKRRDNEVSHHSGVCCGVFRGCRPVSGGRSEHGNLEAERGQVEVQRRARPRTTPWSTRPRATW